MCAATSSSIGGVKIGTGISTGAGGIISIATASDNTPGLMTSDDHKLLTAVNAEAFAVSSLSSATSQLFYNKQVQSPTYDFDLGKVSIDASQSSLSAINAGTYTIKAAPRTGYHWRGSTLTNAQNYIWEIQRAIPETFLSEQAVFLRPDNDKIRIEVESDSSGSVSLILGSTTATLVLGDVLTTAMIERSGFTKEDFNARHPGGKLGSILQRVSDLMHTGDEMPILEEHSDMQHVLLEMTSKRLGCVGFINQNGELTGMLTDGDLRRCLSPKILEEKAVNIMTKNPKTLNKDVMASEVIKIMHEKKITNMFVLENNKPIGVIHIHDLLNNGVA